jgi:hypothetical protein
MSAKSTSRLERSFCTMARAVETSYVDSESSATPGSDAPKNGIESVSTCTIALHNGESGRNVLCGRREHSSGGGGQCLKKGIEHRDSKQRVST